MSRDPKHRPTATQLMNELDSLVRLKSTSGKNLPPPVQPAQPLTRIGSSLKKPASLSKDQVQSLSRKSAAPIIDSAKTLSTQGSARDSAAVEDDDSPV